MKRKQSHLELLASVLLAEVGKFAPEYQFHPVRKWRFDFADVSKMIAVEIEGGTWSGGAHTRGRGFEEDCEKYNEAAVFGWRVFRFTGKMVEDGTLQRVMREALTGERASVYNEGIR